MCKVLVKTSGLSHEEWLKYRKLGLGGSDAGAICGLNPYSSPMSVYFDKIGDEIILIDNEAMKQGRDLEDYVAKRFIEATGLKVRRANSIFMHEQYPHLLANVDRMLVGENIGLECKTASPYSAGKWKDGEVPAHYLAQCYHYMAVMNADAWYIAVVILGQDFKYVKIERDEEIINNLIKIETDFWNNNVCRRVIPEPDGSKEVDELINQYFGTPHSHESLILQGFDDALQRREELNEFIARLEQEKRKIEQDIKLFMADSEVAINDSYRITWKNTIATKLDTERLKTERPDIYQEYSKVSNYRRLLIKAA
ncbi:putative phage-type endonuclease [Mobilisporobacter senegalensis]|uniref:Putative phage-type endonuclease n=1 Tax=Mobilisporobacter senegalensis TaxID=1329262 RepID=A0A3N1XQR5_9FIRM|nr:YqaJ viral recombinase family protein [Mobilisporobacter senegalensis]ROR28501.1 putative phage-type endonuclease [Mobilisporobacter senegalensis]